MLLLIFSAFIYIFFSYNSFNLPAKIHLPSSSNSQVISAHTDSKSRKKGKQMLCNYANCSWIYMHTWQRQFPPSTCTRIEQTSPHCLQGMWASRSGHQLARPAAGDINATLVFYLCELKGTSIPQCCRCRCRCWLLAVRVHRAMRWLIKQTKLISENAWKRNAMQICKCWCLIWISNRRVGQIH